jgi:hypothetical protein
MANRIYLVSEGSQGRKKSAVSVTPELVHILRQAARLSSALFHVRVLPPSYKLREFGERDPLGKYQFALSIIKSPPGFSLSMTLSTQ